MLSFSDEDKPFPLNRRRIIGIAVVVTVFALLWYFRWPHKEDTGWRTMLFQGSTMGTTYNIKVVKTGPGADEPARVASRISTVLSEANHALSNYDETGDLGRFNAHESSEPFPVSKLTAEVILRASEISRMTGGAFDVTVGPLVRLWGFHDKKDLDTLPDAARIAAAMEKTGYQGLTVHPEGPMLSKRHPDLDVDLSAIAKGKGVDMIATALDAMGYQDYMVEVGGEIRVRGLNDTRRRWRIGIERPKDDGREVEKVVGITNMSVATSGDYRSFFLLKGVRYSHTIDPTTGYPVSHGLASVTVLSDDCTTADGLATAFTVLGLDKGKKLAEQYRIAAFFIARQGKNGFIEHATSEFQKKLQEGATP